MITELFFPSVLHFIELYLFVVSGAVNMGRKSVLLTLSTLFLGAALASPARMTKNAGNETDVGNLKLTFDNPGNALYFSQLSSTEPVP